MPGLRGVSQEKVEAIREAYRSAGSIDGTWKTLRQEQPDLAIGRKTVEKVLRRYRRQWDKQFSIETEINQAKEIAHLKGLKRWEIEIVGGLEKVFRKLQAKILKPGSRWGSQDVFSLARAADTIHRIITGGDIRPDFGRAKDFEIFWEILTADKTVGEYLRDSRVKKKLVLEFQRRKAISDLTDQSDRTDHE